MTYEAIYQRMMDRVIEKYPNLDRREGSIISNALMPAALELAIAYVELENARNESFVPTASREYILKGCQDIGMDISVFEASAGVHKGAFNVEVPIDSQWNCELYNYTVTEYLGKEDIYFVYRMECDTVGTAPNNQIGTLTPITDVPSELSYAQLVGCLIEGENETSDEDIRTAYKNFVNSTDRDGNIDQYKKWCSEYQGIGNSKVFPLWDGDNTVKVSILSVSNGVASSELINEFQEYLDPGIKGMGDGVAPIGAFVTVTTATEKTFTVTADVTLRSGYTDTTTITQALKKYFADLSYIKTVVPYMTVGATILAVECVESIANLKVNGGTADITLGDEEIPVLTNATWVVK